MSMLTPPGLGGKYRVKGDRHPRMRAPRNRRRLVVGSLAGAVALGVLGFGTLQIVDVFTGGGASTARASDATACRPSQEPEPSARPAGTKPVALPEPGRVTVNVLNATQRTGLAQKTADALKARGFTVGEVTNAPPELDGKVPGAGLLLGARDEPSAAKEKLLAAHFTDARLRHDTRTDGTVDLVIGSKFGGLASEQRARGAVTALTAPSPRPSADTAGARC